VRFSGYREDRGQVGAFKKREGKCAWGAWVPKALTMRSRPVWEEKWDKTFKKLRDWGGTNAKHKLLGESNTEGGETGLPLNHLGNVKKA